MIKHSNIKAEDYGDMFAQIFDAELIAFQRYGSYQGDYLVVLNDKGIYKFYMGSYGSCSGCDWFEAESNYVEGSYEVDYKKALEYCKQSPLKFSLPKDVWETLNDIQKQKFVDLIDDCWEKEEMKKEIVKIK